MWCMWNMWNMWNMNNMEILEGLKIKPLSSALPDRNSFKTMSVWWQVSTFLFSKRNTYFEILKHDWLWLSFIYYLWNSEFVSILSCVLLVLKTMGKIPTYKKINSVVIISFHWGFSQESGDCLFLCNGG